MKKLSYGMVGGGPGSFIGDAHRRAINIDGMATLVAGCFSRTLEKCKQTGAELGIADDRCYASFDEMAKKYAADRKVPFKRRVVNKIKRTIKKILRGGGTEKH